MYHSVDMQEGDDIVRVYGKTRREIERAVEALAAKHTPPEPIISGRDPKKAKLATRGGVALIFLGLAVCASPFLVVLSQEPEAVWFPLWLFFGAFIAGILSIGGGVALCELGKRLVKPTATELRSQDLRPPIVLLRSFGDDDLRVVNRISEKGPHLSDFEESIEGHFAAFGPFVAIGKPGEKLPTLGAARNYYADVEWQDAVGAWMGEARMLVVIPGLSGGLGWELETIRGAGHIGKLLVLMPPLIPEEPPTPEQESSDTSDGPGWHFSFEVHFADNRELAENSEMRWDMLRAAFAGVGAFNELPEDCPLGLVAMHQTGRGDLILLTGPEIPWVEHYERAIRLAVYGVLCHDWALAPAQLAGSDAPGHANA